jgi:L-threonylcarbamoyladenylate synthase
MSVERRVPEGARAPGLLSSHYAPEARVEVVGGAAMTARAAELIDRGERVALLVSRHDDRAALTLLKEVTILDLGPTDETAAQRLYGALRHADAERCTVVLASPPVAAGLGEAIADRLAKAAGPR